MTISSAHFQRKWNAFWRRVKIGIDAAHDSGFHGPPLRLVQAFPQTLTACEIQEFAGLEAETLQKTAIWIPTVFFGDRTVT